MAWRSGTINDLIDALKKIQAITNPNTLSEILLYFLNQKISFKDLQVLQQDQAVWDFFSLNCASLDQKLLGKVLAKLLCSKFLQGNTNNDTSSSDPLFVSRFLQLQEAIMYLSDSTIKNIKICKNLKQHIALLAFSLNEKLVSNPHVLTMLLRLIFFNIESDLHHFTAKDTALIAYEIHSICDKFIDSGVPTKQYVCSLFLKQAESWQVESTMCDIFKLIVTFVPTNAAQIFDHLNRNNLPNPQLESIKSLLTTLFQTYPIKYMCLLQGLLHNIRNMFYQDYLRNKPPRNTDVNFEAQIKTSKIAKRRLAFIANQSWYDVYKMLQDKINNKTSTKQKTAEELIQLIEQKISQGASLTAKELQTYQDHLKMLQLTQKYTSEHVLSRSSDTEFVFLQQHIRSNFYPYYIPYFQPEYVQQIMHRYIETIDIIDEFMRTYANDGAECHKYLKEYKVPTEFKNHYTLYQLLPAFDTVDFDLYDIQGDDMWTQAHFSQQGLNEIFEFSTNNKQSSDEATGVNMEDMFNLSRVWCKHAYRDYKHVCSQVQKCQKHMTPEQNKEMLSIVRQCINKRELYQHSCVFEIDQGHTDQIRQLEQNESTCV